MSFFQALLTGSGYDPIWTLGDSISRGNSDAVGTTPIPNTVYQWDAGNSNLRMITNLDLLEPVAAGGIGSQWPEAGRTYFELTKRHPVFINTGIGGSAFFNPTAGFSWYTNDTVFATALTKVNNCLAYMNQAAPKLVWINMGINDVVQGHALQQVYLTSLIDRILAEFPGVRICITQPYASAVTTYANQARLYQIRKWIKALTFTYPEVEIAGDLWANTAWGSNFQADNIHLNALGNGFYGDKSMYGICQSLGLHKYARSMAGVYYNRISTTRIGWLSTLATTLDSAGELENIDSLSFHSTAGYTDATNKHKNSFQDIGFIATNQTIAPVAQFDYDGFHPAGLSDSDRIACAIPSLLADKSNLSNDFISGIWLGANLVAATTAAAQHLVRESAAGGIIGIHQNGSSQIGAFAASGAGTYDGTETRPANGFYAAVRDGGTQRLFKNSTQVDSDVVAAVAMNPGANLRSYSVANWNNNGTIQQRWAGTVKATMFAKYTTMNLSTVVGAVDTFLADWLTSTP